MAFLNLFSGIWGVEEMSGSIGVKGTEDPVFCDAIPEENHALEGILLIDEHHFINPVGCIVHED